MLTKAQLSSKWTIRLWQGMLYSSDMQTPLSMSAAENQARRHLLGRMRWLSDTCKWPQKLEQKCIAPVCQP